MEVITIESDDDVIDLTNPEIITNTIQKTIPNNIYYSGIDPGSKNLGIAKWNKTGDKIARSGKYLLIPKGVPKTYNNIVKIVADFIKVHQIEYFDCKLVGIEEQRFGFVNISIQRAFQKILGKKCRIIKTGQVARHFISHFKRPEDWKKMTKGQRHSLKKKNAVKCVTDLIGPLRVAYMAKKKDDESDAILLSKYMSDNH